jgi:WD40 repeat protein
MPSRQGGCIDVDPAVFSGAKGTTSILISIQSVNAINLPPPVRILINTRDASQQGRIINIPGKITDILPDRTRKRLYVTRQDKNAILVYDTTTFKQIGLLRTGNTPVGMAITTDQRFLISGNDNSQIASVFDLESLTPSDPIVFPGGHYPRSVAVSNGGIFAMTRTVGKFCTIDTGNVDKDLKPITLDGHAVDRIDMRTRVADTLPSLGVYRNCLPSPDGVLAESPNNNSIFAALPDGNVILYDASADTFVVSRKDFAALGGGYAALNDNVFLVDTHLLDPALVPRRDDRPELLRAALQHRLVHRVRAVARGGRFWRRQHPRHQ